MILLEKDLINDEILEQLIITLRKALRKNIYIEGLLRKVVPKLSVKNLINNVNYWVTAKSQVRYEGRKLMKVILLLPHVLNLGSRESKFSDLFLKSYLNALSRFNNINLEYDKPQTALINDELIISSGRNKHIEMYRLRLIIKNNVDRPVDLFMIIEM